MLETIEVSRVKRFAANTAGRDFAVGDIHGHFTRLRSALAAVDFDSAVDRLFSVGDLVDRGPECRDALAWLDKPWFHPVRGNHDDYVVRFDTCDAENWVYNGGSWFAGLSLFEQKEFSVQFAELPIAIEVETTLGLIGIVHADCPFPSWGQLRAELESPESNKRLKLVQNSCMWSRRPNVREFPIGKQGVGFDRIELDAWADAYVESKSIEKAANQDNNRPRSERQGEAKGGKPWREKRSLVSIKKVESGKSTKFSGVSDFEKALELVTGKKPSST
jgi:serine/threonine protein phosphatase 1